MHIGNIKLQFAHVNDPITDRNYDPLRNTIISNMYALNPSSNHHLNNAISPKVKLNPCQLSQIVNNTFIRTHSRLQRINSQQKLKQLSHKKYQVISVNEQIKLPISKQQLHNNIQLNHNIQTSVYGYQQTSSNQHNKAKVSFKSPIKTAAKDTGLFIPYLAKVSFKQIQKENQPSLNTTIIEKCAIEISDVKSTQSKNQPIYQTSFQKNLIEPQQYKPNQQHQPTFNQQFKSTSNQSHNSKPKQLTFSKFLLSFLSPQNKDSIIQHQNYFQKDTHQDNKVKVSLSKQGRQSSNTPRKVSFSQYINQTTYSTRQGSNINSSCVRKPNPTKIHTNQAINQALNMQHPTKLEQPQTKQQQIQQKICNQPPTQPKLKSNNKYQTKIKNNKKQYQYNLFSSIDQPINQIIKKGYYASKWSCPMNQQFIANKPQKQYLWQTYKIQQ